ncbi:MAG: cytochrome C [Betaproteobacteria bacterium]|nr:cytochrome C [Betaproteobacteria bacterium]
MCHDLQKVNLKVRQLKASVPPDGPPHAAVQKHGDGQMWCLDCHKPKPRDQLRTLNGQDVDFDDSSRLCAQCHSARHRDWAFGGHGKRVEGWTGERQIYACVHCHDPHDPRILPRAASKPPPVRAGLLPMQAVKHKSLLPWQKSKEGHPGGQEAPR